MSRSMKPSGVAWLGDIPADWNIYPARYAFSEVRTKNITGAVTNALKFYNGTIIRKTNFDAKSDDYVADTITNYTVVNPDTIMINGLNLNYDLKSLRVGLVREMGVITSAYLALWPDKSRIIPEYATYLLKGYETTMAFHNMGSGIRKTLGFKEFKCQPIILPPLEEQQRIAAFLDDKCARIDSVVTKTRATVEEYRKLKQAIITRAVTKGIRPARPTKPSGVAWLGDIPADWEVVQLKRFASVNNGREVPEEIDQTSEAVPVYGSGGVFKYTTDYLYEGETVMFGRKGTLGKPIYANERFWTVDTMYYLTFSDKLFAKFNYYQLCAFDWEPHITQTALPSIVASEIVSCKFAFPPLEEQREIAAYLDEKCAAIDSLVAKKNRLVEELERLKKSLIFEYVTGKKEVAR